MKDIKLLLLRHRFASFTTLLLVFTVNPSIPRESIDFSAGYEVRRPSFRALRTPVESLNPLCSARLFVRPRVFRQVDVTETSRKDSAKIEHQPQKH